MKPPALLGEDGRAIGLGKRIGRGGEGEVFALAEASGQAAKLYTVTDLGEREAKIAAMVAARLAASSDLVAFPADQPIRGAFEAAEQALVPAGSGAHAKTSFCTVPGADRDTVAEVEVTERGAWSGASPDRTPACAGDAIRVEPSTRSIVTRAMLPTSVGGIHTSAKLPAWPRSPGRSTSTSCVVPIRPRSHVALRAAAAARSSAVACLGDRDRHLRHPRRRGAGARGIGEDVRMDDIAIVDQCACVGEHRIVFRGEAGDQVRADRDLRARRLQSRDQRHRLRAAMTPFHALEDHVVASLNDK